MIISKFFKELHITRVIRNHRKASLIGCYSKICWSKIDTLIQDWNEEIQQTVHPNSESLKFDQNLTEWYNTVKWVASTQKSDCV